MYQWWARQFHSILVILNALFLKREKKRIHVFGMLRFQMCNNEERENSDKHTDIGRKRKNYEQQKDRTKWQITHKTKSMKTIFFLKKIYANQMVTCLIFMINKCGIPTWTYSTINVKRCTIKLKTNAKKELNRSDQIQE